VVPWSIVDHQILGEKWIWFCRNEVPFQWKYWMTLMELEFNSIQEKFNSICIQFKKNSLQFNSRIFFNLIEFKFNSSQTQLKRNGIQIGVKGIWKLVHDYSVEKTNPKP